VTAELGGRRFSLGSIVVRSSSYALDNPAQMLELADGSPSRRSSDRPLDGPRGLKTPLGLVAEPSGSLLCT